MSDSDADLVARARRGDAAAFDALTDRHLDAAYGLALALLGERDEAEDCCQDAFVLALQRLDQCRYPERFRSWLLQIVRNQASNRKRSARVRAAIPLDTVSVPATAGDPTRSLELARLRAELTEAVSALTAGQRQVVLLHDLEGWTHGEIAEVLGISTGASRALLFKGRTTLRSLLGRLTPNGGA